MTRRRILALAAALTALPTALNARRPVAVPAPRQRRPHYVPQPPCRVSSPCYYTSLEKPDA